MFHVPSFSTVLENVPQQDKQVNPKRRHGIQEIVEPMQYINEKNSRKLFVQWA